MCKTIDRNDASLIIILFIGSNTVSSVEPVEQDAFRRAVGMMQSCRRASRIGIIFQGNSAGGPMAFRFAPEGFDMKGRLGSVLQFDQS